MSNFAKVKIQGLVGSTWVDLDADGYENVLAVITEEHHLIHEGVMFETCVNDTALGAASTKNIFFTTPNSAKRLHAFWLASASDSAQLEILRGPTVTGGTGSALTIFNLDENSANTSDVFDNTGVPVQGQASEDVTITVDGTQIKHAVFAAKNDQGESRGLRERILLPNTDYVFRLTSNAANNRVQLDVVWYEKVPST